jgi:hypothetical protein
MYGYSSKHNLNELHSVAWKLASRNLEDRMVILSKTRDRIDTHLIMENLRRSGICSIGTIEESEQIKKISTTVSSLITQKKAIAPIKRPKTEKTIHYPTGSHNYYSHDEVQDSNFQIQNSASLVSIQNPFISIPTLADITFSETMLSLACAYFGVPPILSYAKITHSFANDLPEFDTQMWHVDYGAKFILKFIIYLNDVDQGTGPFAYVKGSHQKKFRGWNLKTRFSEIELRRHYTEEAFYSATGSLGTIHIAETTGFHKGTKPLDNARTVLIFNYTLHPEVGFPWNRIKFSKDTYNKMTEVQKIFFSDQIFEIVDNELE